MINAISIALSGLQAATKRLGASASNIANMTTAGSLEEGGKAPYRAVTTTQRAQTIGNGQGSGVIADVVEKKTPFVPVYDPSSVFANSEGLVGMPNVDLAEEAVNMMLAETAYKASLKTIDAQSELDEELLNILDERT
jgi:flagellar basal-body rod protein FlgC